MEHAGRGGMDVARLRAKSVLEQQRIAALYSGDFYKEILPMMYDASIIDQERFVVLMAARDTEAALSTKELLALAIAWAITPSASEFWKRHKSRNELIKALQQKKADIEQQAKLQEQQPMLLNEERDTAEATGAGAAASRRRGSLVALGELFPGRENSGDLFGTKGEYTDGIIYMARRVRMDVSSKASMRTKLAAASAAAQAARAKARMRMTNGSDEELRREEEVPEEDEYAAMLEDELRRSLNSTSSPSTARPAARGHGGDEAEGAGVDDLGTPALGEAAGAGGVGETAHAQAADTLGLGTDNGVEAPSSTANVASGGEGAVTAQDGDDSVEASGSLDSYMMQAVDDAAVPSVPRDSTMEARSVSTEMPAASHVPASGATLAAAPKQAHAKARAAAHPTQSGPAVTAQSSAAPTGTLIDVMSFITKHMQEDEFLGLSNASDGGGEPGAADENEWMGESDHFSQLRVTTSPAAGGGGGGSMTMSRISGALQEDSASPDDEPLPGKLSKLDLYFRPVRDAEKMVVVIGGDASPRATGRRSPGTRDALDSFIAGNPDMGGGGGGGTASPRTMRTFVSGGGTYSPVSPAPRASPASGPYVSLSSPDGSGGASLSQPLAFRHRLGGRAGKLAKSLSLKLREDIPTTDMKFSPSHDLELAASMALRSPARDRAHSRQQPRSARRSSPAANVRSPRMHDLGSGRASPGASSGIGFIPDAPLGAPGRPRTPSDGARLSMASRSVTPAHMDALVPQTSELGAVLNGLVNASLTKGSPRLDASSTFPSGRDAQYDAIAKQVDRMRVERMRDQANERLKNTYTGGARAAASPSSSLASTRARESLGLPSPAK